MALERCLKVVCSNTDTPVVRKALKLAFATTDMKHVNQHFGSARSFAIHTVDVEHAGLLKVVQFDGGEQDGHENKLTDRITMLEGCAVVYCEAVGSSAIRRLLACGIQPLKVATGSAVADLIASVQVMLHSGAPTWLTRAMHRPEAAANRFDTMETEGWNE